MVRRACALHLPEFILTLSGSDFRNSQRLPFAVVLSVSKGLIVGCFSLQITRRPCSLRPPRFILVVSFTDNLLLVLISDVV